MTVAALVVALVAFVPRVAAARADTPHPDITVTYDYELGAYGVILHGSDFTPSSNVELTIFSAPGGTLLASRTLQTDSGGSFDYCCSIRDMLDLGFDVVPGMQIVVTDPVTTIVRKLTLVPFTIDVVDPVADTVSGTAPPNAPISVWLTNDPWNWQLSTETVARDDGTWSVDLASLPFHLAWTAQVQASTWDEEGNNIGAYGYPATIEVKPGDDTISGSFFSLDATVTVQIFASPGGALLWSGSVPTVARHVDVGPATHHLDLVPGMLVRVTDPAGFAKEVTIVPLTIDVLDPVLDRAAGTAAPGTTLQLYTKCPCWDGGGLVGEPTAGANGKWSFDYANALAGPTDFTPAAEAWATVADPENDTTLAGFLPATDTVVTLQGDVAALVASGTLRAPLARVLTATLDSALASLTGSSSRGLLAATGGKPRGDANVKLAIVKLRVFVVEVDALVLARALPRAAGAELTAAARRIIVGLGG